MSRAENFIIGQMDRRRERESAKAERTARDKALEDKARDLIAEAFHNLTPAEQADFLKDLIAAGREKLVALVDAPGTAAFLSQQAYEAGRDILPRRIARATAEQLFSKAANEDGPTAVGDALASALDGLDEPARSRMAPVVAGLRGRK